MEPNEIDAEINAITGLANENLDLGEGSVPDEVEQFFAAARIDVAIGKSGFADTLHDSTQDVHKRAAERFKATAPAAAPSVTDDSHRLEKRYMGIHKGKKAARVVKSQNGQWTYEYDERGELIRGYAVEAA
jgi:hypothetical protein